MPTHLIQLDHLARTWVVMHRVSALDAVMQGLSFVGRGGVVFAVAALVFAMCRRQARPIASVALALLLATLVSDYLLKPVVHRERPFVSSPEFDVIGGRPHDPSFPSGHAANAFGGAVALTRIAPAGAVVWWGLAVAVAYSRVYLGVHYPADVIAGAIVGVAAGLIATSLFARVRS